MKYSARTGWVAGMIVDVLKSHAVYPRGLPLDNQPPMTADPFAKPACLAVCLVAPRQTRHMSDAAPEKPHEETDAEIRGSAKHLDRCIVLVQHEDPPTIRLPGEPHTSPDVLEIADGHSERPVRTGELELKPDILLAVPFDALFFTTNRLSGPILTRLGLPLSTHPAAVISNRQPTGSPRVRFRRLLMTLSPATEILRAERIGRPTSIVCRFPAPT